MSFTFNPTDGYNNVTTFPTKPANETEFRSQMMTLLNQIRDYINNSTVTTALNVFVADLNNLSLNSGSGFYGTNASTLNTPSAVTGDGSVIHIARDSRPSQIFTHYATNRIFTRGYNGTSWNAWSEIMEDTDFAEDVLFSGTTSSGAVTLSGNITQYRYLFVATGTVGTGNLRTSLARPFGANNFRVGLDFINVSTSNGKFMASITATNQITITSTSDDLRNVYGVKWPF